MTENATAGAPAPSLTLVPLDPRTDLAAVIRIEEASFPRPWNRPMFLQALASPATRTLVARTPERVVTGYLVAHLVPQELQIHTVAVDQPWRGRGVGRLLVTEALNAAASAGAAGATLEVRRSNDAARRLYESLGFRCEAVREAYYRDPTDDALVYWRRPTPPTRPR